MPLAPLAGHLNARQRLARAVQEDRLPQALLLIGPEGSGRQRLALWLAQLLMCERPGDEPCGSCVPCRKVLGLAHPDVHWFVPIPRPKAGEPGKQMEEARETLAAVMDERRESGLWGAPDGMAGHGMASVRLLQREAGLSAVESRRRIFIIGDAERLAAQAGQEDAANALLKLLEEPPTGAVFLLTAADARRLLPTIRSRTAPLRLAPLADDEVERFLTEQAAVPKATIPVRVRAARGSIGVAMALDESAGQAREAAERLLAAATGPAEKQWAAVLAQGAFQARGGFTDVLDAAADLLLEAAREAGEGRRAAVACLRGLDVETLVTMAQRVQLAREEAQGNVNPQLLTASLMGLAQAAS